MPKDCVFGVIAEVLNLNLDVRRFKLQQYNNVYYRIDIVRKSVNPFILPTLS